MADPTYRVVIMAAPVVHVLQSAVNVTYRFALPSAQKHLKLLKVPLAGSYHGKFGLASAQRVMNPVRLKSQDFRYAFRFFYPSNGTVPGSPIPRSGQVSPRPV